MFPLSHEGRGSLRADFLTLMQDFDSPLPLWERDADTCNEFCSGAGEGSLGLRYLGAFGPARAMTQISASFESNATPRAAGHAFER